MLTIFVVVIVLGGISSLVNKKIEPASAPSTVVTQPEETKAMPPPPPPSEDAANANQLAQPKSVILDGAGPVLKDVRDFPVTIIINQRIDVLNGTSGFGLDPGDELLVLRFQDSNYIVSHQDKEYIVEKKLIEDMKVK